MSSTILNQSVTSGLKIQQDVGGSGLKGVVIGNSSNLQATVIMQNAGISRTLYPYTVDFFDVPHDASGNPRTWSGNLLINFTSGSPDTGAYVQVDTIGANEPFKNTYPISLSRGTVGTVTQGNTLTNEINSVQTLIIDIGETGSTLLITIYSDGSFTWKVLQSGVAHTLMQGSTSGVPLTLGQVSDETDIAGNLKVVGTTALDNGLINTSGGHLIINNNVSFQAKNASGTAKSIMRVDASNNLAFRMADNNTINLEDSAGTIIDILTNTFSFFGNSIIVPNLTYYQAKDTGGTARNILRINSLNEVELKGITGTDKIDFQTAAGAGIAHVDSTGITVEGSAKFNYQQGSLSCVGDFSGTGNATVNTNITNPTGIAFDPCTVSGSSQTIGGTIASSSVVTTGAGLAWRAWSYKG